MPKPKILADNRERDISARLSQLDTLDIVYIQLDVADFVLSTSHGIQRKRGDDLIASVFDGRWGDLVEQKKVYPDLILVIEEKARAFINGRMSVKQFYGAVASALVHKKLSVIETKDADETAIFLERLAFKLQEADKNYPVDRKRPPLTPEQEMLYFLQGLPGCGPEISMRLLAKYKTPWIVLNNIGQDTIEVERVGPKMLAHWRRVLGI